MTCILCMVSEVNGVCVCLPTTREPTSTTVDGKRVERVERVTWQPDDERLLRAATIIGRGAIYTEGGGRLDGLVVALLPTRTERSVTTYVVAWERTTRRFVAFPLRREP